MECSQTNRAVVGRMGKQLVHLLGSILHDYHILQWKPSGTQSQHKEHRRGWSHNVQWQVVQMSVDDRVIPSALHAHAWYTEAGTDTVKYVHVIKHWVRQWHLMVVRVTIDVKMTKVRVMWLVWHDADAYNEVCNVTTVETTRLVKMTMAENDRGRGTYWAIT